MFFVLFGLVYRIGIHRLRRGVFCGCVLCGHVGRFGFFGCSGFGVCRFLGVCRFVGVWCFFGWLEVCWFLVVCVVVRDFHLVFDDGCGGELLVGVNVWLFAFSGFLGGGFLGGGLLFFVLFGFLVHRIGIHRLRRGVLFRGVFCGCVLCGHVGRFGFLGCSGLDVCRFFGWLEVFRFLVLALVLLGGLHAGERAGCERDRGFLCGSGARTDCLPGVFLNDFGLSGVLVDGFAFRCFFFGIGLGSRGGGGLVTFGGEHGLEFRGFAAGMGEIVFQGLDSFDEGRHRLVPGGGGAVLQPGHVDLLFVDPFLQLDHLATGLLGVVDVLVGLLHAGFRFGGAGLGGAGHLVGLLGLGLGLGNALIGLCDLLTGLLNLRLSRFDFRFGLLGLGLGLTGTLVGFLDPGFGFAGLGLGVTGLALGLVGAGFRIQKSRIGCLGLGGGGRGLVGDPGDQVGVDGGIVGDGAVVEGIGPSSPRLGGGCVTRGRRAGRKGRWARHRLLRIGCGSHDRGGGLRGDR